MCLCFFQGTVLWKPYIVPSIIIGTYLSLYLVPKHLEAFYLLPRDTNSNNNNNNNNNSDNSLRLTVVFLMKLGLAVDPFTYLILTKQLRNNLIEFVKKLTGKLSFICIRTCTCLDKDHPPPLQPETFMNTFTKEPIIFETKF